MSDSVHQESLVIRDSVFLQELHVHKIPIVDWVRHVLKIHVYLRRLHVLQMQRVQVVNRVKVDTAFLLRGRVQVIRIAKQVKRAWEAHVQRSNASEIRIAMLEKAANQVSVSKGSRRARVKRTVAYRVSSVF